jgi:hypothetical protein
MQEKMDERLSGFNTQPRYLSYHPSAQSIRIHQQSFLTGYIYRQCQIQNGEKAGVSVA